MQAAHSHVYMPAVKVGHWSSKKGLGTHFPAMCDGRRLGATWRYSWLPNSDLSLCPRIESVPMVYSDYFQRRLATHQDVLGGNSRFLLGYNEPDRPDQANLSPEEAAVLWHELETLYPNKQLVSPAVSQLDQGWLQRWYDAYHTLYGMPPRMEGGIAGHCYYHTCSEFIECARVLIRYADQWGLPGVWLTEFAPIKGEGFDQVAAARESRCVIRWLERAPRIKRYAWFATRLSGDELWVGSVDDWCLLINHEDGLLTVWGRIYAMGGSDG